MKTTFSNIAAWALRIVAALLMVQSLFYKFSGAEESIYIFSTMGIEPWGRYATGTAELIASVLLLIPRFTGLGALLGVGIMGGAIVSHLTTLGIEVQNDGGLLFIYAIIILFCCFILLFMFRQQLFFIVEGVSRRKHPLKTNTTI